MLSMQESTIKRLSQSFSKNNNGASIVDHITFVGFIMSIKH